MLPELAGAAQLRASGNQADDTDQCQHSLAFGLIGKNRPHRIIKNYFGNMNVVFGSEVALLGFLEYMFGILVTVYFVIILLRLKGTVSRDFRLLVFFTNQFPSSP